ncbi:response regulator [Pseudoduganella violaceinigra]|uniref:response regulator n=1 Tax=Pseudoduganella violaceinigra TaxID=246602 RepID=UPI0003FC361C|nr:response regulator [Pseudoduganella violaceinigra]
MTEQASRPAPAILYVDDEATALKYFQRALGSLAPVYVAESVEQGKRMLDEHAEEIAVLVSDQRMPGAYGNELLFYAWDRYPHIVRILTTAYSELEHTVDAVNQGQIHRYIAKPWDIAALRMELKQALALARLQKEHAQLLREKLLVRQKQAVASRIGALYTLAASLDESGAAVPVESYLAGALSAGMTAPEPDWLLLDHSDLISSEAFRSAAFGRAVRAQLQQLEQRHGDGTPAQALEWLAEVFGPAFRAVDAGHAVLLPDARLAEFLETPTGIAVSEQHAFWLACLMWLGRRGATLQLVGTAQGVECRLAPAEATLTPAQLAAWVEQF